MIMKMQPVFKTGQIHCRQTTSETYEMKAMHIHDVYEIYMAQSDGVKFLVNDRLYDLERGDVMLFSNKDLHKVSVPDTAPYKRYVITFAPELLFENARPTLLACFEDVCGSRSHRVRLTPKEQAVLISLMQALQDEQYQTELSELGQQLALCRILVFLNRVYCKRQQQAPMPVRCRDMRIGKVLEYIDNNYSQKIALDELSDLCYLNKHYLCRLFKRETGFCMNDYIVYRRLSAAVLMLKKGESVSVTARLCGFTSDTFFITTFKKQFGMTPHQYMRATPETNKGNG